MIAWIGDSISVGTIPRVHELRRVRKEKPIEIAHMAKVGMPLTWMGMQVPPERTTFVVLAGGTNDLMSVSPEVAFERLREARARLSVGGRTVVVGTIPTMPARPGAAERFNELVRTLGTGKYFETGGALSPSDISADGVHPTEAGYRKLAERYHDALEGVQGPSFWTRVAVTIGAGVLVALGISWSLKRKAVSALIG